MKGKEKVKSPILSKKRSDLHEKYISCGQYINWNLEGLSILESEHAFIVQEVRIEVAPLNQYVEAAHYFEAWEVKDGKVMGVKDADCDDMFRIGDDLDEDDLIRDSMGKFGTVLFIPKVYVVKSNSELYDCVNSWPLNGVKQSNGLKSCKANTKLEEAFKNVPAFILVTEGGIFILSRASHIEKADTPILVTEPGILMFFRLECLKQ